MENFYVFLVVHLHENGVLRVWKHKLLKMGCKVQVFENETVIEMIGE